MVATAFTAVPAAASAATLTNSGGTLTYTADAGKVNLIGFDETGTGVVEVHRFDGDDDPINATGCTAEAVPGGEEQVFECTGVTKVVASAGDMDDQIDAGASGPGFGGFNTLLTTIPVDFDLGSGSDFGAGGHANDIVKGGDGNDAILLDGPGQNTATGGADTGFGGAGDDFVGGGRGNDSIDGEAGRDFLSGGPGDDTVSGGAGADGLSGGLGTDKLFGNSGDDTLEGDCTGCAVSPNAPFGSDDMSGGDGIDRVFYNTQAAPPTTGTAPFAGVVVTVTVDDQQNDGRAGESADNVRTDVEIVDVSSLRTGNTTDFPEGSGNLKGSAGFNNLIGGEGNDTLDPLGGNDIVSGNGGNDNINTVDGFADTVSCGDGNDTATVDQFDTVDECETLNRQQTANANEDRPPTVAWVRPAANASMSTRTANVLEAAATDDRGISQVQFVDDGRVVCIDFTAPYTCNYRPQGDDVGRNTLAAIAIDTTQQTATALRSFTVPRFSALRLTATTRPRRDPRSPYRFTTTGRLTLPSGIGSPPPYEIPGGGGVTSALGCKGKVAVTFKAGRKTVSNRRVNLTRNCTYRSRVTFRIPSRLRPRSLRVTVRFMGNEVVSPRNAPRRSVRVR